ncbi:MAG: hypothetical protein ACXABY_23765, partial [Candidatus Thorarchaeota archaeon]
MDYQDNSVDNFRRLVKKGESRIYPEEMTAGQLLIWFFLPVILGICTSVTILFIVLAAGFPMTALAFFAILLGPTVGGFIVAIIIIVRAAGRQ